jgi:organic radical activating enzyme
MPQPPTLKITEIFPSIQGEGLRQGEPTIFIRLSGCNLRCTFCDTRYAWEEGDIMTRSEIMERVEQIRQDFPADWICLTGGEPLLQDVEPLLADLKARGYSLQVETNATQAPALPVDWYTLSPKPDAYAVSPELIPLAKEVKLVVNEETEFQTLKKLRDLFPADIPLLLQPESNRDEATQACLHYLEKSLGADMKNLRLSLQLHKLLDIP